MQGWVTLRVEPLTDDEPREFVGFIDTCHRSGPPMLGSFADKTVTEIVEAILGDEDDSSDGSNGSEPTDDQ